MIFNPEQLRAIQHVDGPMLVLAGPGSGKTAVITERLLQLVGDPKNDPSKILVITFTKAATAEMESRFQQQLYERQLQSQNGLYLVSSDVVFSTIHSLAFQILKQSCNISQKQIITEAEKYGLLQRLLYQFHLEKQVLPEEFFRAVSQEKAMRFSFAAPNSCQRESNIGRKRGIAEQLEMIMIAYQRELQEQEKMDLDDLLLNTVRLLKNRPDMASYWQEQFSHILVDEFQDTNDVQLALIRCLAPREDANVFVVGDDDQSIYGFRGADARIMNHFLECYPKAQQVVLKTNYRSGKQLLEHAGKLIAHNRQRIAKKQETKDERAGVVQCICCKDISAEQQYVIRQVKDLLLEQRIETIGILTRTNQLLVPYEQLLRQEGIGFSSTAKHKKHEKFRSLELIGQYMVCAAEETYSKDLFFKIANSPNRYIGRDCFQQAQVRFSELRNYYKKADYMAAILDKFEIDLKALKELEPFGAIQYLLYKVGVLKFLKETNASDWIGESDAIKKLLEYSRQIKHWNQLFREDGTLTEECREALFETEQAPGQMNQQCSITLTTYHGAKGMEFDAVILPEVSEGIVPAREGMQVLQLEEERRMFYVAVTRAKSQLYILFPKKMGNKNPHPSRFLKEMGIRDADLIIEV